MDNNITLTFGSLAELQRYISATPMHASFEADPASKLPDGKRKKKWYGTKDYAAADELMTSGYQSAATRIRAYMATANITTPMAVSRQVLSVTGHAPCVGRALSGHPRAMYRKNQVLQAAKVVKIIYAATVSRDERPEDIERTAAKILNVIVGLEKKGIRVELHIANLSESAKGSESLAVLTKIKDAGQPLNVAKMTYPLTHPSYSRRHIFAVTERCGLNRLDGWSNYGRVIMSNSPRAQEIISRAGLGDCKVLGYYQCHSATEAQITEMLQ